MAANETVAVLGAGGTMGFAMSRNIARAGVTVHAWNRTRARAEPLAEDGVQIFDTAAEAAAGADVILTMLTDADAVLAAVEGEHGALAAARDGAIWLQMSTIGIEGTERCAALARERGIRFVDAPVLGTKQPAEQGRLVVLASGPEDTRAALTPIFDAIGDRTLWLGEAGAGSRLKLVTNAWLVAIVEGAAEAIALSEGLGVDPRNFLEAVRGGGLDAPYLQLRGKAMIERDFTPSFRLSLAAKDARLAAEAAARHHLELPLVALVRDRLAAAAEQHGDEDVAAAFLVSAPSS
ncbi:MAG: 3-hydroxyisobutyrate dehydrogenase [Conexibacter sp.]|nr:3-hydroxyisobutyrate dehydrogenase [Conexibacter sp.]